jgi:alkylation response protein AidB-like acyl-CoA dehydrogenase
MGRDGWLGVGWPQEYGGRGLGQIEQQIFVNEATRADIPLPAVTLQTVGPTLQIHGTAEQKDFFLPKILAGEVHFAIGYTEPEAGTDLAALRTRAVRAEGDGDYVVHGQKIFTTCPTTPTTSGWPAAPTRTHPGTRGFPSSSWIPVIPGTPGPRSSPTTAPTMST